MSTPSPSPSVRHSGVYPVATSRTLDKSERRRRFVRAVEASDLFSPDWQAAAAFLADAVTRRADGEFIARHPVEAFAAHVSHALKSVVHRQPHEVLVRCSRPTRETEGYDLPNFVLETCMADQPFIVDTVKLVLRRLDVQTLGTLNMILPVERDSSGAILDISQDNPRGKPESFSCHLLSPHSVADRQQLIADSVREALTKAHRIAADFRMIKRLIRDILGTLEFCAAGIPSKASEYAEESAFAEWLLDDHFVMVGAYGFDSLGRPTGRLGLGRYDKADLASCETDPAEAFTGTAPLVSILQSRIPCPVHRDAPLVEVRLRTFDGDGLADGGVVIQGLFTYTAVTSRASQVPFLRGKLAQMVATEDLVPSSHRMKLFLSFFDRLPLAFSFAASAPALCTLINEAIDVDFGGSPRVWFRVAPDGISAQVFALLSQGRFSDDVKEQLTGFLVDAFGAHSVSSRVLVGKTDTAIVDLLIFGDTALKHPDPDTLSDTLSALISPMSEAIREQLRAAGLEEAEADRLSLQFGSAMPSAYPAWTEAPAMAEDLRTLAEVVADGATRMRLRRDAQDGASATLRLLVYTPIDIALTDILPILDNFGLRVLGETTWKVTDADDRTVYYETYRIASASDNGPQLLAHGAAFLEAMQTVMDGRMNNTSLNRLLLASRLNWRQLQVVRAYLAYARQLGVTFAAQLVQQVLFNQPALVATLIELFDARFAPELEGEVLAAAANRRVERVREIEAKFRSQLAGVQDAVEDKVLRMFHNLFLATLRTNFYQRPQEARGLSFKFRCADVELMPEPRPMVEIWVFDPRVEGVHLRGGKVARGGLRWSDRLDDFRTEILSLMQTQMVKNTLIVPVGSKGGFVLKKPERDDQARRKQADELYKVFISGLLDLTDNLVRGENVPPDAVVCYDDPDPYLVVAADKGTAHLSDTANGLALARGFWLGDAFASGGSKGYDHKLYGITAKGAWVNVVRHFREMGINPQVDPFTCFGIGDMSGDVFGNGLLLSQAVLLRAAFDHRHIFLDPNPDALVSFGERQRLFDTPRSHWAMYDPAKLSAGGGIFPRTAKSIALTAEVREMLGVQRSELSGEELMHAILQMPADLLWNGGIGTYVKASTESSTDVGDKTNDNIRIDAGQLRCRVVGEGGNLGFTQAARVEAALAGVHLYTDAVDNSAGVDLSDHEVNLKIAFAPLLQDGRVSQAERDSVLQRIDNQVCQLVLYNNYQQSQGLSVAALRSAERLRLWGDVVKFLVDETKVDQEVQMLPSKHTIGERRKHGLGLTRPEMARITAFVKMWIYNHLSADRRSTAMVEQEYLAYYFPQALRDQYQQTVDNHMLRHEIVATLWTNAIVDFGSALLIPRLQVEYGRSVSELCQTYTFASRALGLPALRSSLMALDFKVPAQVQYEALSTLEEAAAAATEWVLANQPGDSLGLYLARAGELTDWAGDLAEGVARYADSGRSEAEAQARLWVNQGLEPALAYAVASSGQRARLFAIWQVGQDTGLAAEQAAAVYFAVADVTSLAGLLAQIAAMSPQTRWEAMALASLAQGLGDTLTRLAVKVARHPAVLGGRGAVRKVLVEELKLGSLWDLASQIASEGVQIPALVVLSERLRARLR